jgi:hypothetical protein
MKKQELKKALKPIIKECIKEVIFEDGVLSGIISEVARGMQTSASQIVTEAVPTPTLSQEQGLTRHRADLQKEAQNTLAEKKKMLENSLGGEFKGIFENMEPMRGGSTPGSNSTGQSSAPLSGYSPGDEGVDISGILAVGSGANWKNMI